MDFLLIDCTGTDSFGDVKFASAPVKVVSGVPTLCPPELTGIGALLVRPDGYVAWAQDRSPIPGAPGGDPAVAQRELQRFLDFAQ